MFVGLGVGGFGELLTGDVYPFCGASVRLVIDQVAATDDD